MVSGLQGFSRTVITQCVLGEGLSNWFCLSVRPSVRPSVHSENTIYRVKPWFNTAVILQSEKNVPDSDQGRIYSLHFELFLIQQGKVCHFYGQEREYSRGREYAVSGHGVVLEYT